MPLSSDQVTDKQPVADSELAPPARLSGGLKQRSLWGDALRRLARNRMALFGLSIVLLLLFVAIFGPAIAPYDYLEMDLAHTEAPPSRAHWLGTDELGRDFLSRIIYGARTAVLVAVITSGVSTLLGLFVGALSAYMGGWWDMLLMRLTDVLMAFPTFLLAVFVNATIKPPVASLMGRIASSTGLSFLGSALLIDYVVVFGALALVSWPGLARLVRGQILGLRKQEFVLAAQAVGVPTKRILLAHLLPNALGPVIVSLTTTFGYALLTESSLSFIGVGIQPPAASWGAMINENLNMWRYKPHLVAVPGGVLALVVLAFNVLGDGVNSALNPKEIIKK